MGQAQSGGGTRTAPSFLDCLCREHLLASLGIGAMLVGVFLRNSWEPPVEAWPFWVQQYGAASVILLALLALGLMGKLDRISRGMPLSFNLSGTGLALVSSLLLSWKCGPVSVLVIAYLVFDACMVWLVASWLGVARRFEARPCVAVVIMAAVVYVVVKILIAAVPEGLRYVMVAMATAASIACLAITDKGLLEGCEEHAAAVYFGRDGSLWSLWSVGACMAAYVFMCAVTAKTLGIQYGNFSLGARLPLGFELLSVGFTLGLCAFIVWWVFVHKGPFAFLTIWRLLMVIAVVMLLGASVSGNNYVVKILATPVNLFAKVLVFTMLANVMRHSDANHLLVASFGMLFYTLPKYVGHLLVALGVIEGYTPLFARVMLAVLALVTAFCAASQSAGVRNLLRELDGAPVTVDEYGRLEARCRDLAAEHGLSDRELDVMLLLVKGRSKPFIAEELFISENTVRTHAKRVYSKLSVHTKAELQELVGA